MGGRGGSGASSKMLPYDPMTGKGNPELGFADRDEFDEALSDWTYDSQPFRHPKKDEEARAAAFDAEIDKGEYDGEIRRGIAMDAKRLSNIRPGSEIDMGGASSWSKSASVADGFADENQEEHGGEKVVFVLPDGTKHGTDIENHPDNHYPTEREVTVSSKSRMKVMARYRRGDTTYVYCEEI